jgi:hypothetical protein
MTIPRTVTATSVAATNDSRSVLESATDRVLTALRHAWQAAKEPRKPGYAKNCAGDVLSRPNEPRITPVNQIMAMLRDSFERGAAQSDLLTFPDSITHEIEAWYLEREAATPSDFGTAHLNEERAEAEADIAEAEFQRDPCFRNLKNLEHKHRAHRITAEAQIKAGYASLGMLA